MNMNKTNDRNQDTKRKLIDEYFNNFIQARRISTDYTFKHVIVWKNLIGFLILHLLAAWGLILILSGKVKGYTVLYTFIAIYFAGQGVTMGAHRLYAHRSFKAHPILKAILLIAYTIAGQNSMLIWCRDHRLHHRYSETDGDPHNSKRGFFFSHIGWLMTKKHPLVIELQRKIDLSDLEADWMIMFQKKYYFYLYILLAVVIPVWVPVHFFYEKWFVSVLVCYFFRYVYQLNGTWLVNSAAHLYGTRPYDRNLQPVECWYVSLITFGEGWHNYHHAFPWDYKTAELSMDFNITAILIRWFEKIGLTYDLKTASNEMVMNKIKKSGDGTHYELGNKKL